MPRSAAELKFQIRQTRAFIDANFFDVVLTPRARVMDGTGTTLVDQAPRVSQRMVLIDLSSSTRGPQPGMVRTADGTERLAEYMLLGLPDAAIGLYDRFSSHHTPPLPMEVAELMPDNGYERRALVVQRGEA